MPGVKGSTGAPGVPNPKKRNATTFGIEGDEPKGKMIGFRPPLSLEAQINEAVEASGKSIAAWLKAAAIAYLEKESQTVADKLEQGQLNGTGTEEAIATEPAISNGGQAPIAGDANGSKDETGNAATQSKSQGSVRARSKTRKTTRTGG